MDNRFVLLLLLVAGSHSAADWLRDAVRAPVSLSRSGPPATLQAGAELLTLQNQLLSRVFAVTTDGGFGTWDLVPPQGGSALRAMSPEAVISLDNVSYHLGGLVPTAPGSADAACPEPSGVGPAGSCPVAYLNRSQHYMANRSAFRYVNHTTLPTTALFPWTAGLRHSRPDIAWPPAGLGLQVTFRAPEDAQAAHRGITATVRYELYEAHPVLSKWVTVRLGREETRPSPLLPPDQRGPVHIEPCGAADSQRWLITSPSAAESFGSPIFLAGPNSDPQCLTATNGTARHSNNDKTDVRPCQPDTADTHQLWVINASSQRIASASGPCLDVNNHQADNGTVCQVDQCAGAWHWKLLNATKTKSGLTAMLEPVEASQMCLTYRPEAPPPPPPPGPPPLPRGAVVVTGAVVETLRVNQPWGPTEPRPFDPFYGQGTDFDDTGPVAKTRVVSGYLYVHNSQRHGSQVWWTDDPSFESAYAGNIGANEPVLTVSYAEPSPDFALLPGGEQFTTFRVMELFTDTVERERQGLMRRKLVRLLAPQTTESPMFMHLTDVTPEGIEKAVDQIAAVGGFDMIIFSFGSGFNLENDDPTYLAQMAKSISYAKSKGVEIGGYDLIADTRSGTGYDTLDPATGQSTGNACFASRWAEILAGKAEAFINATGLSMLETDGPYAGQPCAATDHAHHRGVRDSVQAQWTEQAKFYAMLRSRNIFVHAPDD